MVASLQDTSLEEECFTQALLESHITAARTHPNMHTHSHSTSHTLPHSASALPLSHESAMKWFYKDPQGEIQGDSDYHVNLGGFLCVHYSIKWWAVLVVSFRSIHYSGDVWVVSGGVFHHEPAGQTWLWWGISGPGWSYQDVGACAFLSRPLPSSTSGEEMGLMMLCSMYQ